MTMNAHTTHDSGDRRGAIDRETKWENERGDMGERNGVRNEAGDQIRQVDDRHTPLKREDQHAVGIFLCDVND